MAKRNPARAEADDLAVIAHMRDMPLKEGQMLLLGPKSVEILRTGKFAGVLPDRFVFDRENWNAKRPAT